MIFKPIWLIAFVTFYKRFFVISYAVTPIYIFYDTILLPGSAFL